MADVVPGGDFAGGGRRGAVGFGGTPSLVAPLRPAEARQSRPRPSARSLDNQLPPAGVKSVESRDNLWSVLHQREVSPGRNAPSAAGPPQPPYPPQPQPPSQPLSYRAVGSAALRASHSEGETQLRQRAALPMAPHTGGPGLPAVWNPLEPSGPCLGEGPIKVANLYNGGLFALDVPVTAASLDAATALLERRLDAANAEQRADISRRFEGFEQVDRRFKEWVQREHEQWQSNAQQVRVAVLDAQQQHQRQLSQAATQNQRLEIRVQELEGNVAQVSARADGIAHAIQAASVSSSHGAAIGVLQAALDVLRTDLQREIAERNSLGVETADKVRDLHNLLNEMVSRHAVIASGRQQAFSGETNRQDTRFAALEPAIASVHVDVEALREQLRTLTEKFQGRCEEVENSCVQRIAGVSDAALNAARELWEEHHGMVAECKGSLASLQQILASKDAINAQLQALQQRQRETDKHEVIATIQQGLEALRHNVLDLETASMREHAARIESQAKVDTHIGRLGVALEKAQTEWVHTSDRIMTDIRETRRRLEETFYSEVQKHERLLTERIDVVQLRLDELEPKVAENRAGVAANDERISLLLRNRESQLLEVEVRIKRLFADSQSMLVSKIGQCDLDLRAEIQRLSSDFIDRLNKAIAGVNTHVSVSLLTSTAAMDKAISDSDARWNAQLGDVVAGVKETTRAIRQSSDEKVKRLHDDFMYLGDQIGARIDSVVADLRSIVEGNAQVAETRADGLQAALKNINYRSEKQSSAFTVAIQDLRTAVDADTAGLRREVDSQLSNVQILIQDVSVNFSATITKTNADLLRHIELRASELSVEMKRLAQAEKSIRELITAAEVRAKDIENSLEQSVHESEALQAIVEENTGQIRLLEESLEGLKLDFEGGDIALQERLDELEDEVHRNDGYSRAAEAGLQRELEERSSSLRASLAEGFANFNEQLIATKTATSSSIAAMAEDLSTEKDHVTKIEADVKESFGTLEARLQTLRETLVEQNDAAKIIQTSLEDVSARSNSLESSVLALKEEQGVLEQSMIKRMSEVEDLIHSVDGQSRSQLEVQVTALRRMDELDENLHREKGQARAAEAALEESLQSLSAKVEEHVEKVVEDMKSHAASTRENLFFCMQTQLDALKDRHSQQFDKMSAHVERQEDTWKASFKAQEQELLALRESSAKQLNERLKVQEGELRSLADLATQSCLAKLQQQELEFQHLLTVSSKEWNDKLEAATKELRAHSDKSLETINDKIKEQEIELREFAEARSTMVSDSLTKSLDKLLKQSLSFMKERLETCEEELRQQVVCSQMIKNEHDESDGKLRRQIDDLKKRQGETQATNSDVHRLLDDVKHQIEDEQALRVDLGRKVDEIRHQSDEVQSASKDVSRELDEVKLRQGQLNSECGDIRREMEDLKQHHSEMLASVVKSTTEQNQREFKELERHVSAVQATIDDTRHQLEGIQRQKDNSHDTFTHDLQAISKRVDEISAARDGEEHAKSTTEEHQQEFEELKRQVGDVQARIDDTQHQLEVIQRQRDSAHDTLTHDLQAISKRVEEIATESDGKEHSLQSELNERLVELENLGHRIDKLDSSLRARLDGALDAIIVWFETQRWVNYTVDGVTDVITNSFLSILDNGTHKLEDCVKRIEGRVERCEALVPHE